MTTLYRPVLIESAEQAEALPGKTPVLTYDAHTGELWFAQLAEDDLPEYMAPRTNSYSVALVPIEAEEQHITAKLMENPTHPDGMRAFLVGETPADMTRLVTPWEDA